MAVRKKKHNKDMKKKKKQENKTGKHGAIMWNVRFPADCWKIQIQ